MRTKTARKDLVLGPFIDAASEHLDLKTWFRFNPIIQKQFKNHRRYIMDNMLTIRRALEEDYGRLLPIRDDGWLAGRGRGNGTVGYQRVLRDAVDSGLADEDLLRKQQIAGGLEASHNNTAEKVGDLDGQLRPVMTVDLALIGKAETQKPLSAPMGEEIKKLAREALLDMFNGGGK